MPLSFDLSSDMPDFVRYAEMARIESGVQLQVEETGHFFYIGRPSKPHLTCSTAVGDSPFWDTLDHLLATAEVVIDRPKGSADKRFPDYIYPYDYGYLEGTVSGDGDGIDVWIGRLPDRRITGIICSIDLQKRDAEIKILLDCTHAERAEILNAHNFGDRAGFLIEKPDPARDVT